MSEQLRVNPIACTGHGLCSELLPERVTLDEWGYPVISPRGDPREPAQGRTPRGHRLPRARPAAQWPPAGPVSSPGMETAIRRHGLTQASPGVFGPAAAMGPRAPGGLAGPRYPGRDGRLRRAA